MIRTVAALLAFALSCLSAPAATLLPPGEQQFTDANGKPYSGGTIAFYVPGTTTVKQTWSDPGQSVLNSNPVVLDSAGRTRLYGSGAYRMVLKDQNGNLVYDQLTADTSSSQIAWGGKSTGNANAQTVSATNFTSADGQIVGFIAGYTNTGQLAVSANGSGFIPVLIDTQAGAVNLQGQEIQQGAAVLLIYDASRGAFHLVGGVPPAPGFGAAQGYPASNVLDLGLAAGSHNVAVTGGATITSFGSTATLASPIYVVSFTGPSLIKAGSIGTPASADLPIYPGDALIAAYQGGGNWQIVSYQPQRGGTTPSGMIAPFGMSSCPAGWAAANGQALPRANSALYAAIGAAWGAGDGSSTFNAPDLRGYFLRGVDAGAGRDANRSFASAQADAVGSHGHNVPVISVTVPTSGSSPITFSAPAANGNAAVPTTGQSPSGAGETRPMNVAINYCIKL